MSSCVLLRAGRSMRKVSKHLCRSFSRTESTNAIAFFASKVKKVPKMVQILGQLLLLSVVVREANPGYIFHPQGNGDEKCSSPGPRGSPGTNCMLMCFACCVG